MNKALLAIGAVVCVGLIGPKVVGSIVEEKYADIASRLVDHPTIEVTERSFTRHWFSGQARSKMKFKGVELDHVDIIVSEQLSFGPIIFADNSIKFALAHSAADIQFDVSGLNAAEQKEIAAFTEQLNEKLTVASVISYGLNYSTHIASQALVFEQDRTQVSIGALDSEFTLSDEKYLDGYLNWSGLDIKGPKANVQVSPLTATFAQEVISGDIYAGNAIASGDFAMKVENINAQDNSGNELLNIDQLSLVADSSIEQALMNVQLKYGAERFKGAGQALEKLNLDISLHKLDPKVLIELNDLGMKAQQEPANAASYGQQLNSAVTKLLATNPEIKINDFSVVTPDGVIQSDLQLLIDHTLYNQANPMSIIAALNADAKGIAPLPFFQKLGFEGMINMYIEQGFIVKDADKLSFAAQFKQGQLTVNGNTIAM
ncbi:MAG: DUF945 family protein [Cognaticolwellia sp.]